MKHIYAGHYHGKRPTKEDEITKPLHPQIARFYQRWGAVYNRQDILEGNPKRRFNKYHLFSVSLTPAESSFEKQLNEDELFIGSLKLIL